MRKYFIAAISLLLFAATALPVSADPSYTAADSFDRLSAVSGGWGTSQNSVSATNYDWAGDLASDSDANAVGGYGLVICNSCTLGEAFSGTLGHSHLGGTATLTFENLSPTQQISVALDASTDLSTAYLARVNYTNGKLEIVRRSGSSDTVLSSTSLPCYKHSFMTVSLTVNGTALSATAQYAGGSSVSTSTTDGSPLSCGKAGVYIYIGATQFSDIMLFDSFSATQAVV